MFNSDFKVVLFDWILSIFALLVVGAALMSCSVHGDVFLNSEKVINSTFSIVFCILIITILLSFKLHSYFQLPKFVLIDFLIIFWLIYVTLNVNYNYLSHNEKYYTFCLAILHYFLARIIIRSTANISFHKALIYGLTALCLIQMLIVFLQLLGYFPVFDTLFEVTGTFKNPAALALFLSSVLPISLSVILFDEKGSLKVISSINILLIIGYLVFIQNRTSIIAVITVSFVLIVYRFQIVQKFMNLKKWMKVTTILSVLTVTLVSFFFIVNYKVASSDGRLLIWRVSSDVIKENPFFGKGYGSFKMNYTRWQIDYFEKQPNILNENYFSHFKIRDIAGYVKISYNEYLEIILEQGIIGFLIFMSIIFVAILMFSKSQKNGLSIGYFSSLITILILGLFSYPFYSLPTFFLFTLMLAIVVNNAIFNKFELNRFSKILFLGLLLAIGTFLLWRAINLRHNFQKWLIAETLLFNNDPKAAELLFKELEVPLKNHADYLLSYGNCLVLNNKEEKAENIFLSALLYDSNPSVLINLGNIYKDDQLVKKSESYYRRASLINPSHVYPKYLLFKLYQDNNMNQEAIRMALEIKHLKVKIKTNISDNIKKEVSSFLTNINSEF